MIQDGQEWRLVHYEADILSRVPWDEVDVSALFDIELAPKGGEVSSCAPAWRGTLR